MVSARRATMTLIAMVENLEELKKSFDIALKKNI